MASPAYRPSLSDQVRAMTAEVKTLVNARLKDILREEGLPVSGVKSELQIRIIAQLEKMSNTNDVNGVARMRDLIAGRPHNPAYQPYMNFSPPQSASPHYPSPGAYNPASNMNPFGLQGNSGSNPIEKFYGCSQGKETVNFKPSPFYTILKTLTSTYECKAREHTRDTAQLSVYLDQESAERLQKDPNLRVMVFCAGESYAAYHDIAFPHQVELRCNSDEVKANLRGLKNKPGSTRPADVTSMIRKKAGYPNNVEMIYALTQKAQHTVQKFYLVVNLVQKKTIDELVKTRMASVISKDQVRREMLRKRDDPDIEATSTVLSLKCPLSAMRITVPMRSSQCLHNQCFDAASYLQLQEQAPTWTCPVCNRLAPFDSLQMDLYVDDILKSTSSSTEQVIIEPDGQWHLQNYSSELPRPDGNPTPDEDDFEGFIEIRDNNDRISALKAESRLPSLANTIRTPPTSSREQSIASSSAPRSNKRPASEVIDLTLSDDDDEEEDEDARPAKIKRPSLASNISSFRVTTGGVGTGSNPLRTDPFSFELPRPTPPSYRMSPFNTNS